MNSETVSRYGKFVMYVLWLLGCLCAMAVVLLVEPQRVNIVIPIVVYMFVGLFLMSRFSGKTAYTFDAFCYTFFGLASLLAVFVCVITQSSFFVLFVSFLEWLIVCFSLQRKVANRLLLMQVVSFLVLLAWNVFGTNGDYDINLRDVLISCCYMVVCCWIATGFISLLNEQQKQNNNQQQSLDDLLYIVESLRDEDRKRVEQKIEEISYMSNAIHRMNRTVHSMNESISREKDMDKIREYSGILAESESGIHKMTEEINTYMRLEKGEVVLREKSYDLGKLLEDILGEACRQAEKKQLAIQLCIGEDLPRNFVGDSTLIGSVLRILLSNAVEYTDRGRIEVRIYRGKKVMKEHDLQLCVDVCDTGHGIRQNDLSHIFEPYYRVEEFNARRGYHAGLGLHIASQYASILKGSLSVESEYGTGSVFRFQLTQAMAVTKDQRGTSLFAYLEEAMNRMGEGTSPELQRENVTQSEPEERRESKASGIDLPPIHGIHWDVALQFLVSRKNILETLEQFLKSGNENIKQLREYFRGIEENREDAFHLFQIKAHAIKSNLKMIGAVELSDQAKKLEYAARDGNTNSITENTVPFLDAYTELLIAVGKIPEIVSKNKMIRESYHREAVLELLDGCLQAMEHFEMEQADETMKKLEAYEYPEQIQEMVSELSGYVLNLDTDGAGACVQRIKELME